MTTMAVHDVIDKATESVEFAARINGFHLEPRCRICRNDQVRTKVNGLLATGASYAMVLRALGEDNATLDKRDQVTIDSIRNHTARHFPVKQVAGATYREILERRARENQIDFVMGVATAITPMAFYETVMVKGFATLVDSDTKVDVNTGMIAAGRLQALIDSRVGQPDMARIMVQVTHIIGAVKSTVPRELWGEIVRKLDQLEKHPGSPDVETESCDEADEAYDPIESPRRTTSFDPRPVRPRRLARWPRRSPGCPTVGTPLTRLPTCLTPAKRSLTRTCPARRTPHVGAKAQKDTTGTKPTPKGIGPTTESHGLRD